MARLMAFDFGTKRLGIAVTDPLQIISTALTTIHPKDVVEFLKNYLLTEQIETFIVGEPKQMDSSPSESARHVEAFINLLKKQFPQIPIERMDERFTSKMASQSIAQSGLKKNVRQKKELIDTVSAVIILQSYMEKRSFGF
ncbi:Holliday junction resolvase RuvX [Solitalea lacus]|uniref:Holliday junction resolvase RuvX n=1 Tax=Solitalea lacus TaxID=2911172 RepID=UPI001EDB23E1|nr:Holliday junction resolvase RuvX [Solitalea lacus]UKJ09397.1 Holliday junction resolvase RuvX [Solitalea lacus]